MIEAQQNCKPPSRAKSIAGIQIKQQTVARFILAGCWNVGSLAIR